MGTWNDLTSVAHIVSPRTRMVSPRSRSIKLTKRELPSFKKISLFHLSIEFEKKTEFHWKGVCPEPGRNASIKIDHRKPNR